MTDNSLMRAVKNIFIGRERELTEHGLFHNLSLVALLAFFGWYLVSLHGFGLPPAVSPATKFIFGLLLLCLKLPRVR